MTFHYHFGDVALHSSIAIEGLRPLPPGRVLRHAMRITHGGQAPVPDKHYYAWPGRYRIELGEHGGRWLMHSALGGSFLIERDASAIHIAGDGPRLDPMVSDMFVRRVLPRVMILLGAGVVHSASLASPDGGVMMLGPSGAGKSTLSAALAKFAGWTVMADDMSVLWLDEEPMLAPAAAGLCLWQASFDALGFSTGQGRAMPGYDGKTAYWQEPAGDAAPAPLRAVLMLQRSPEAAAPRLERLPRSTAMATAIRQLVMFNPHASAAAERVASITRFNTVLGAIPAWRLTYPASFAALPSVAEAIGGVVSA